VTGEAFMDVLKNRRSIRRFHDRAVPKEVVCRLIEAATWAPSAGNRQNWEFAVVTSAAVKEQMAEKVRAEWKRAIDHPDLTAVAEAMGEYSKHFDWFSQAPVLVVLSAKSAEGFMSRMFGAAAMDVAGTRTSVAMAAENLMLAAHALGIGSCCLTAPLAAHEAMKALLGLGARQVIVCLIALGYADEEPAPPPRKAWDEVVRFIE
jgi:nitroreductase